MSRLERLPYPEESRTFGLERQGPCDFRWFSGPGARVENAEKYGGNPAPNRPGKRERPRRLVQTCFRSVQIVVRSPPTGAGDPTPRPRYVSAFSFRRRAFSSYPSVARISKAERGPLNPLRTGRRNHMFKSFKWTPANRAELQKLRSAGKNMSECAYTLGCASVSTIYNELRRQTLLKASQISSVSKSKQGMPPRVLHSSCPIHKFTPANRNARQLTKSELYADFADAVVRTARLAHRKGTAT